MTGHFVHPVGGLISAAVFNYGFTVYPTKYFHVYCPYLNPSLIICTCVRIPGLTTDLGAADVNRGRRCWEAEMRHYRQTPKLPSTRAM